MLLAAFFELLSAVLDVDGLLEAVGCEEVELPPLVDGVGLVVPGFEGAGAEIVYTPPAVLPFHVLLPPLAICEPLAKLTTAAPLLIAVKLIDPT